MSGGIHYAAMNTQRAWRRFLVVGIVGATAFFVFPTNGAGQGILQLLLNAALAGALVVGIRRGKPERPIGWWTMTVGATVYLVANAIWFADPIGYGGPLSFPSVADWFFIAAYLLIAAGLFMLGWRRRRALDATVDAFLCCTGVGVLSWWFLIDPAWHQTALTPVQVVVTVGPPLVDLVILFAVLRMLFVAFRRGPAVWLLAGGVATQLVADTWMGFALLNGTFRFGQPYFAGWLIFFVLTGTAALHPSMRNVSDGTDDEHVGTGRIVVVVAATIIPIAIGLFGRPPDDRFDFMVLWSVAGALILVATTRLGLALRRVAVQREGLSIANAGLAAAEERYRLIFQNAMEGIFQIDTDGIVVTANPAFAAIAGWESSQQLVESHLQASSFLYEQADAAVLARSLEGSRLEGRELRLKRRDGAPVWVSANVRLVDDEAGVICAEGSVVDVTAKLRAQEALEKERSGIP